MEGKKISFGFLKTKKVEKPVVEERKDFIECLEEKSIKVVGGEKVEEEKPLVIPMKPNTLITAERLREIAEKVESGLDEVMPVNEEKIEIKSEPIENETLDQLAVRELLQEAKKEVKVEKEELTVPVPAKPVLEGEKESTLYDYESVPIQDFGMAMLRGMGWTANKEQLAKYKQPQLRPKGLGLGADKVISDKQKKKMSKKDGKEELAIVTNSFIKIIAGKHSGYYGKVISLDEENGRVMVDITVKKETVSLSEFMMQPVTKTEFDKESKVINTGAYEEYKKNERSGNQKSSRNDSPKITEKQRDSPKVNDRNASSSQRSNDNSRDRREKNEETRKDYDKASNGREKIKQEKSRRDSSDEEGNSRRRKEYKRDSSNSEDRNSRRRKEKSRRDSSSEDKNKSNQRKKEKARRDSSREDKSRSRKEIDKKRYSSNESLDSISDSEQKKKHNNHRRRKDSSDSASEYRKKDKRDIDKKRKGKKKKRDRDRSPNYKKHRK